MFKMTTEQKTETQTKAQQTGALKEDELDQACGGSCSQCESDDGRGTGGSGSRPHRGQIGSDLLIVNNGDGSDF